MIPQITLIEHKTHYIVTPDWNVYFDVAHDYYGVVSTKDQYSKYIHDSGNYDKCFTGIMPNNFNELEYFLDAHMWEKLEIVQTSDGPIFMIKLTNANYVTYKIYENNNDAIDNVNTYYISVSCGDVYFESKSLENVDIRNNHGNYKFKNIRIKDENEFNKFMNLYSWTHISVENTDNGYFLVIELDDDYYGRPMFKIYPVL